MNGGEVAERLILTTIRFSETYDDKMDGVWRDIKSEFKAIIVLAIVQETVVDLSRN